MRILRILIPALAVLIGLFFLARWLVETQSPTPDTLGIVDGRLAACPASPNCVSTRDSDAQHAIAPLTYDGSTADARARILAILEADPQATIITSEPDYIHAEFRSPFWQFIDDVEFQFEEGSGEVQFRSASRLGYGDMGANRDRMQAITAAFTANP